MVYIGAMPELLLNSRSEFKSSSQKNIYIVYVTMASSTHQEERIYISIRTTSYKTFIVGPSLLVIKLFNKVDKQVLLKQFYFGSLETFLSVKHKPTISKLVGEAYPLQWGAVSGSSPRWEAFVERTYKEQSG